MNEDARLRANAKAAADYEAHPDVEDTRSADEIDADMRRVREEMTETVNQLAAKLDPKRLQDDAKRVAQQKVDSAKVKVQGTVDGAAAGDQKSIAVLAGAALAVVAVVARLIFKKR